MGASASRQVARAASRLRGRAEGRGAELGPGARWPGLPSDPRPDAQVGAFSAAVLLLLRSKAGPLGPAGIRTASPAAGFRTGAAPKSLASRAEPTRSLSAPFRVQKWTPVKQMRTDSLSGFLLPFSVPQAAPFDSAHRQVGFCLRGHSTGL